MRHGVAGFICLVRDGTGRSWSSMKVLVVGSGGREHALVWKLAQSPLVERICAAPGNAGIADVAECVPLASDGIEALASFAAGAGIDLTVVGPEAPLVAGIVDLFASRGLRVFGFDSKGARLEGSKVWAKQFMERHRIPTGSFSVFNDAATALAAVAAGTPPFVIKADGLAAGKGVLIARAADEARSAIETVMSRREFGAAGDRIVMEEFLSGEEISLLALYDGKSYRLFAPSQDH
jgi:phosphoribosylamine--glycine ligase